MSYYRYNNNNINIMIIFDLPISPEVITFVQRDVG